MGEALYVGADAKESAVLQGAVLVDAYRKDSRTRGRQRERSGELLYFPVSIYPSMSLFILRPGSKSDTL